ncbi:MAG: transporter substrate-binding domain-containing protein [Faecalibacterium sp.]|nr:transporter substrate-binding domain-containing protein [Ruminococcus sp.]MCM1392587.1 transporter substrate-binding domain-containing protein [Ruminococcus sp.]MCM1486279.1 transporter substrate-binding domain-containing protein [Faecalibacterium sp.]
MKKVLALVLAALMLFSLAACGGNANTETEKKDAVKVIEINLTDEDYAFGVDKDQPELLEQVNEFVAKIKADGTFDAICDKYFGEGTPEAVKSAEENTSKDQLVIATNAAFAPFEYKEGDSFYGIDMEIAALLAKELGKELVIKDMKFESVCLSVGQHKCDIAMAGLTVNEDRKEQVTFSESYYKASQQLIVKADDTTFDACTDLASVEAILNGFDNTTKIGFQNGTTAKYYVEGDEDWGFDGLKVEGKGYDNGALAVKDMLNGNINFVMIDAAPAARIAATYNAA